MRLHATLITACLFLACGAVPETPDGGPLPDGGPVVRSDGGLDLNDVSWLMPLSNSGLLPLDGLLPRGLYDAMPGLITGEDQAALFSSFRIVSARIDPCFPETAAGGCIKQLRLVAQPVIADGFTSASTEDATIHLFYALSDADFDAALVQLAALKSLAGNATTGQPLDVHPVMKREGMNGRYATTLKALITSKCSAQNLSRVAFMKLVQKDVAWLFGAFNVVDGALVEDVIPRLDDLKQQGVQEFGSADFPSGQLQPEAVGDFFPTLLSESEFRITDDRTFTRAITSALHIEHPAKSSPKTIDCASCHTVSRALTNAQKERPFDMTQFAERFVGNPRFDLRRVDEAGQDPRAMRSFGYFGKQSALSQRTINESAEVADALTGR